MASQKRKIKEKKQLLDDLFQVYIKENNVSKMHVGFVLHTLYALFLDCIISLIIVSKTILRGWAPHAGSYYSVLNKLSFMTYLGCISLSHLPEGKLGVIKRSYNTF